ncbi:MAG: ECF-type sigma factor [Oceanococcaceae bacterium]
MSADDLTHQGAGALYAALYDELKQRARRERRKMVAGQTLATTALVNEAFMKLANHHSYTNRQHFLMTAAQAMRQVLVDDARSRWAEKRGSGAKPLSLDATEFPYQIAEESDHDAEQMLQLDAALEQLRATHPRLADLVECRYFGGYSDEETAAALGVTTRTLRRDWLKAKALLYELFRNAD